MSIFLPISIVKKICKHKTVSTEKLCKTLLYENAARKKVDKIDATWHDETCGASFQTEWCHTNQSDTLLDCGNQWTFSLKKEVFSYLQSYKQKLQKLHLQTYKKTIMTRSQVHQHLTSSFCAEKYQSFFGSAVLIVLRKSCNQNYEVKLHNKCWRNSI